MRVTIRDVAASLKLSVATVSLALNDSPLVKHETAQRVKDEATCMGYIPNPYARSLARGRSGNIALVVPDIQNVYYASLVHHINEITEASGYQLMILISHESLEAEQRIIRSLVQYNVEAILLAPVNKPNIDAAYVEMLNALSAPLIFTTARYSGVNAPCIISDLKKGMMTLTQHIVRDGGERIAYLTGSSGVATLDMREAGYCEVLKKENLKPEVYRTQEVTYENAYAAVHDMKDLPDALLCVNDMMAIGALNALSERGVAVPEDIRIAGFDDGLYSRVSSTPLTSVTQDIRAIASASIDIALKGIHEGKWDEEQDIVIPCELRIRKSTETVVCMVPAK